MSIDLHMHTREGSDGAMGVVELLETAKDRGVTTLAITDHDSVAVQETAEREAARLGIGYVTGIELNAVFDCPEAKKGIVNVDILGYGIDYRNGELCGALKKIGDFRVERARKLMDNVNAELGNQGIAGEITQRDFDAILAQVEGSLGRPHLANMLIEKGFVSTRQEAFDRFLVQCNVPKYQITVAEASELIRGAGGKAVLAHPNDPNGVSLRAVSESLSEQTAVIEKYLLPHLDGIECWHARLTEEDSEHYLEFVKKHELIATAGSDCHQKPVRVGSIILDDSLTEEIIKNLRDT